MVHCGARLCCFVVSFITVKNCEETNFSTSFASQNIYLLFMSFFPDIIFQICLMLLYFVLAIVVFIGHIPFIAADQIKTIKKVAKTLWTTVMLMYAITQFTIIILFSRSVIDKHGLIVAFGVTDIVLPCLILVSEYKLHERTSGMPYQSSIFKNTKNHLNFRVFYWIFARFCHAILCLVLLKFDDLKNYVEMPNKTDQIENYIYFMMIASLTLLFMDKMLNEVLPLYLVINQDFMDLFSNMRNESKDSLLQKTDVEDRCDLDFLNSENPQVKDGKIAFNLLNFETSDLSQFSTKKNKPFGNLRKATCSLINQNNFLGLEELSVRVIELTSLSPYIIESVTKDCQLHQDLQKISPYLNIVNLIGYSIEDNKIALIYQHLAHGSLHSLVHTEKKDDPFQKMDFQMKMKIAFNVAKALQRLHHNDPPIIHGHLTPNNIILDKDFTPKIGDILFYDLKKYCTCVIGYQNKTKYTAPEYLKENGGISNNPKTSADVYSYGLIMWELVTEIQAFQNIKMNDLKKIIDEDSRPKIPEDVPEEIAKLIRCCWQKDPEKRPSFDQIADNLEKLIGEQETFESFVINGDK